jgi:hypothetical protein
MAPSETPDQYLTEIKISTSSLFHLNEKNNVI